MLEKIRQAWQAFWFAPASSLPMAVFRIFYGLVLLYSLALLCPNLTTLLGAQGIITMMAANQYLVLPSISLFNYLPAGDQWLIGAFVVMLVAAVMLTLGVFTRFSAFVVWIGLITLHNRNLLILNSGDTLLTLGAYYLVWSNAGDMLALDRFIMTRIGKTDNALPAPAKSPWAQRLLQFQMALIYLIAFWSKLAGDTWLSGTAVYYALHIQEFSRISIPLIANNIFVCKMLTWGTLAIEASAFTLIWFRSFRYYVLVGLVLLHLGIELTMNIPAFEWIMIASLVVFVYPTDLEKAISFVKRKLRL